MNFKEHFQGGLIVSSAIAGWGYYFNGNIQESLILSGVCLAGSQFPDLDTDSTPSKWLGIIGVLFCGLMIYLNLNQWGAWFGLLFALAKSQPHRGITHAYMNPIALIILSIYLFNQNELLSNLRYAAFGIGIIVHLALDKANPIKYFYRPFRLPSFKLQ